MWQCPMWLRIGGDKQEVWQGMGETVVVLADADGFADDATGVVEQHH